MANEPSMKKTLSELVLTIDALKEALREKVFQTELERSAVLGLPRLDYEWPEVFVLMPFKQELMPIYKTHIRAVAKRLDLSVGRADDFFTNKAVMGAIWSAINAAGIIIADCTGRNPNVMYEVGLAHAIGREVILISQTMKDIPFDLRHLNIIVYTYTPPGMKKFENALAETIKQIPTASSYARRQHG